MTIDCCFRYPWHQHFPPKLTKQPKSAAFLEAEPVNEGLPVKWLLHSDVSQTLRRMGGVPDDQSGWGKLGLGWMVHGFMRWWCLIGWEWFEHVPMIGSWGNFHSHVMKLSILVEVTSSEHGSRMNKVYLSVFGGVHPYSRSCRPDPTAEVLACLTEECDVVLDNFETPCTGTHMNWQWEFLLHQYLYCPVLFLRLRSCSLVCFTKYHHFHELVG